MYEMLKEFEDFFFKLAKVEKKRERERDCQNEMTIQVCR